MKSGKLIFTLQSSLALWRWHDGVIPHLNLFIWFISIYIVDIFNTFQWNLSARPSLSLFIHTLFTQSSTSFLFKSSQLCTNRIIRYILDLPTGLDFFFVRNPDKKVPARISGFPEFRHFFIKIEKKYDF